MKSIKNLMSALLLLTGVWCKNDAVFMYSKPGGAALLPCTNVDSTDCSLISWTFWSPGKGGQVRYTYEVSGGKVSVTSDKSSRMSITSNCSLHLRDLKAEDAGSYVCLKAGSRTTDVYLSLLAITSFSKITDLQPGGNLTMSCILFTYYDAGSCKSYNSAFSLSWATEDGTVLPEESRYELIAHTRCNITLVTKLQKEDNNRKWRCQVNITENRVTVFQDFTSVFLFQNPSTTQNLSPISPSSTMDCEAQLPISRIMLCVALPVMVMIVGFFTWRGDRKRAKTSSIELQEIDC
ncbi:uncharacterized protein LOC108888991 [Lates japonicus]|uniref:Ig-like domain-containing protein n=1 Tax=Lates japonicus TaxID=270547 RepID=A0AAD3N194_LATJO|nr:uncharacterized protein AKAME5_001713200 [Lates japonicus]